MMRSYAKTWWSAYPVLTDHTLERGKHAKQAQYGGCDQDTVKPELEAPLNNRFLLDLFETL